MGQGPDRPLGGKGRTVGPAWPGPTSSLSPGEIVDSPIYVRTPAWKGTEQELTHPELQPAGHVVPAATNHEGNSDAEPLGQQIQNLAREEQPLPDQAKTGPEPHLKKGLSKCLRAWARGPKAVSEDLRVAAVSQSPPGWLCPNPPHAPFTA